MRGGAALVLAAALALGACGRTKDSDDGAAGSAGSAGGASGTAGFVGADASADAYPSEMIETDAGVDGGACTARHRRSTRTR